jgi:hypothetical protein
MSRLDNILSGFRYICRDESKDGITRDKAQQKVGDEIKSLFLELVGDDEKIIDIPKVDAIGKTIRTFNGESFTTYMIARNQLRAELRQKVEEL